MKLPNKYGTVYKLSGKRRRPWIARKLIGQTLDEENKKVKYEYLTIGYFATRSEALQALAAYNTAPYMPKKHEITLKEAYDRWSVEHFPKVRQTGQYLAAIKILEPLWSEPLKGIKLDHLQTVFNSSGKNTPMLRQTKVLLSLVYDYAFVHEIIPAPKRDMIPYIDVGNSNPNKTPRRIFDKGEISRLIESGDKYSNMALVLICTGLRISELADLLPSHVDYDHQYLEVVEAKTKAGVRVVPIADQILPAMQRYMSDRPSPNVFRTKLLKEFDHRPHDTRHTFATLMAEKGIDQRVIDSILGHSPGNNVALTVYTHITLETKLAAVNLLEIC